MENCHDNLRGMEAQERAEGGQACLSACVRVGGRRLHRRGSGKVGDGMSHAVTTEAIGGPPVLQPCFLAGPISNSTVTEVREYPDGSPHSIVVRTRFYRGAAELGEVRTTMMGAPWKRVYLRPVTMKHSLLCGEWGYGRHEWMYCDLGASMRGCIGYAVELNNRIARMIPVPPCATTTQSSKPQGDPTGSEGMTGPAT